MSKSDDTKQKITDIAFASFRDRGYEKTTLRLIAAEAGISVGNAYYYFPTKTHLVQALYEKVQNEHRERATPALETDRRLANRLETVLLAGLDVLGPYDSAAAGFLGALITPGSAVSPFGDSSAEARELAISLFRDVVEDSDARIDERLRPLLPELLWLGYLALVLYWTNDRSDGKERSRRLASRSARLLGSLLPLTRLPFLRKPVAELVGIVIDARS